MPATPSDQPPAGPIRTREKRLLLLRPLLQQRILVLDGATGTLVQRYGLSEADFRGERFRDHPRDVRGDTDLLTLTRPDVVRAVHDAYLAAGADIISTDTFTATRIAQADYGLEERRLRDARRGGSDRPRRGRRRRGRRARHGRASWPVRSDPPTRPPRSRRTWPTRPPARSPSSSWPRRTPRPPAGCSLGGADLLMVETIFDVLNAKAAIFAIEGVFDELDVRVPLWISGTITDASGRTLSGHTVEAFWNSVRHARPLIVGLNCALGARQLRAHVEELSGLADTFVAAHPNAGLPNEFGGYDETPEAMAAVLREFAGAGLVNVIGGCCGTGPAHVAAFAEAARGLAPGAMPQRPSALRLAGLEPLNVGEDSLFLNIGERTNVAGSRAFARRIVEGDFDAALEIARRQVDAGAQAIDVNMDEALLDSEAAMTRFLNLVASEPAIARVPIVVDSSKWSVIEAGLRCIGGKPIVNSISLKEGEAQFLRQARLARRYGAAVIVMAFDERGPGRHGRTQGRDLPARLPAADRAGRLPGGGRSSSTRTSSPSAPASRSTPATRSPISRRRAASRPSCPASGSAAASATCRSPSAATTRCARRSTPSSCTTPSPPAWTWASSTRASWRSTRRSRRSCWSASRTWSSTAGRTPRSGCSRSRPGTPAPGTARPEAEPGLARAAGRGAAAARPGRGHRHLRRRGHRGGAAGRRPPDRGHRGPADGRHERRRRPVRRGQDVPAPGGQERPGHEEGGRPPGAVPRGGEGGRSATSGRGARS